MTMTTKRFFMIIFMCRKWWNMYKFIPEKRLQCIRRIKINYQQADTYEQRHVLTIVKLSIAWTSPFVAISSGVVIDGKQTDCWSGIWKQHKFQINNFKSLFELNIYSPKSSVDKLQHSSQYLNIHFPSQKFLFLVFVHLMRVFSGQFLS